MSNYEFKPVAEIVRAVGLAVIVFVAITATRLGDVQDFQTYWPTFLTALASVVGTAVLGAITKPATAP